MRKTSIALTAAAGVFAGIASVGAESATTVLDDEIGVRIFLISNEESNGTVKVERAFSDDVVGVYCQWTVTGNVDLLARTVSDVKIVDHECKALEQADTDQWTGGATTDFATVFPNPRLNVTPDGATNTVVEQRLTGPNDLNIISEMRRAWDFNANKVCLSSEEARLGESPYISFDHGCYDIPDNHYTQSIRKSLSP